MTGLRRTVTAIAAVGVLLVVPAAPAFAHTELTGSAPARDATVTTAVTTVTLTFSEPVRDQYLTVNVLGADGVSYSSGSARAVDSSVVQAVTPLPVGLVRVAWRVLASDADPVQGAFTFTNVFQPPPTATAAPTTPAAEPTTTSAAPPASLSVDAVSSEPGSGAAVAWIAGVVVGLGVVVGIWLLLRSRRRVRPVHE